MTSHIPKSHTVSRPPIISIMGHVDHGKSTLLDYIRKTNTVDSEVGGITQKLSAYEVLYKTKDGGERKITFLDTPGHEAFCAIRKRGAKIADVAIIVVSAEDGVKPQTLEALACVKETETPFIIAINKIDKSTADVERAKQSLAEHEIYVEGYGGDISAIPISAKTGAGVGELIELATLSAEMRGLSADVSGKAEGVVIETAIEPRSGILATVIVINGRFQSGMSVVADRSFSPGRVVLDSSGKKVLEAGPSTPLSIAGFDSVPEVGTMFKAFNTKKEAIVYLDTLPREKRSTSPQKQNKRADEETDEHVLPIFLNADLDGSLEAISYELAKIKNDRLAIRIVQKTIGDISEDEVKRAGAKQGTVVIGFNVKVDQKVAALAERLGVEIQMFDIVYKLAEWLETAVATRTPKVATEEITGRAKVVRIFSTEKTSHIVGGRVESGRINLGAEIRIVRRETEVGRGKIKNLQQSKTDVREVPAEKEFGAQIQSSIPIAVGDCIEIVEIIMK